jgi:hypothetical protein
MRLVHRVAVGVLAVLAAACGSGGGDGGGGGGDDGIAGRWFVTIARAGIDDDPRHVTVSEDGGAVTFDFTCDESIPLGVGTYVGGALDVTFDLGGGDAIVLTGTSAGWGIGGTFTSPDGGGTFWMGRTDTILDCALACDPVTAIRFVDHDYTELAKMEEISLFRSDYGHSYVDGCESCRSMKHYYAPFDAYLDNGLVAAYSPVDGTVVSITAEGLGAPVEGQNRQVRIRSTLHPEYQFILFHIDLLANPIEVGDVVSAGEQVGTLHLYYPDLMMTANAGDIAVQVHTLFGHRLVSFFDTMTDALFSTYVARGATTRSDFVLTKAARDADPITCDDETFTSSGALPAWFTFPP